jgi:hypothetical protein
MPAVSAAKDVASIRPTEPRPLPKLLGIKSRDRMGRDHSSIPRSKPTPAARFPVTYETFCTRRPSEVKSVVESITTAIECDDTLRSGGWEIARNRLVSQGRFCPRLGKNRSYFNAGLETLNQRVQGSSPCAPTTETTALFAFPSIEQPDHFGGHSGEFVPVLVSRPRFAYPISSLWIATRAKPSRNAESDGLLRSKWIVIRAISSAMTAAAP